MSDTPLGFYFRAALSLMSLSSFSRPALKSLLKEVDRLFGDDLKRYYKHREAINKGLQGNPDDRTYLIFAIDNIKKNISFKTYEEAAKNTENK